MKTFAEAEKFARENLLGLWGHFDEIVLVNAIESGKFSPKIKIMRIEHSGKDEYVVLRNITGAPIDLTGWKLFSEGEQWYTFPDVILQPGEEIEIHSGPRAEGALTWTKRYVWNNRGDKAILYDSNGNVVDTYSY